MRNSTVFFFVLAFVSLISIFNVKAISVSSDVQFSFGCPVGDLPKNCSGNYKFEVDNLTFFDIQLYPTYSLWDLRPICKTLPFFQLVHTYPDIYADECSSVWVEQFTPCSVHDNQTKYYIDTMGYYDPLTLPLDNGTTVSCNFCSQDLIETLGVCSENSTQSISWTDYHQSICCDITNFISDCSIREYPFNETTIQTCNSTMANIGKPNCRENPQIGDNVREDCVVEIPTQYMNEDYKCLSLVKEKDTGYIVQINPKNSTGSIYETKDYFTPMYSSLNFYYTGKDLQPDKEYIVRAECSSTNRTIYSEYTIQRGYEDLSWVYFRTVWLKNNASYIIGGGLLVIFIIVVGGFLLRLGR